MEEGNESELEKRAVEELLKEASRARVRAETMGPAGWMKCPLGSTNKRFLLNTLRQSAFDHRAGSRASTTGSREEDSDDTQKTRHHRKNKEHGYRKDYEHRRERSHSHSQSSRHRTSSRKDLVTRCHSPSHSDRSNRARSRSPVRDRSEKHSDRTKK